MATTMPLSEVPLNHVRRNGQLRQPQGKQIGKFRPTTPNGDGNGRTLQEPSSVHSMLRNTTETGDVGQFSIKPSRVPSSIPRPLAAPSSRSQVSPSQRSPAGSYYSGYGEYNGQYNGHITRHAPPRSRHGAPSSNGSLTPKHSHEQFRGPQRNPSIEDYRTYSMTQSSFVNHSLTQRHPYGNGHHQGRGSGHNLRPRSPFAYPTRLKRPGYRPSSPALSDLNRSMASQSPGPQRDPSTRAGSPSSAYNMNRALSPWQQGFNRSDPMLRPYPQTQSAVPPRVRTPSQSSTRPSPPKPSSSLRRVTSSSQLRVINDDWPREESPPSSPIFYDYTEAFDEPDLYHSTSMTTGVLVEQSPSDTRTDDYFVEDESPEAASPAELPANDSPKEASLQIQHVPVDQRLFNFNRNTAAWTQISRQDLSDVLELPEKEMQADQSAYDPSYNGEHRQIEPKANLEHPEKTHSTVKFLGQQMQPPTKDYPGQLLPEIEDYTGAAKPSRVSYHGSSTPVGSVPSTRSSPRLEIRGPTPEPMDESKTVIGPQLKLEIPTTSSDHGGKYPEVDSAHPVDSLRAPSFEGHSGAEFTEILSPTPERSIASPGSRNRFSKILSIDEGISELDPIVSPQVVGRRNDSPSEVSRTSSFGHSNAEHLWRKRSSFFRDKPAKPPLPKMPVIDVLSDSEEEPELSNGLRATFCKPESQSPQRRDVPTPTPQPSRIPRRGIGTPLKLQRSPAPRKSIPDMLNPVDESTVQPDRQDKATPTDKSHVAIAPPMKEPPPADKKLPPLPKEQAGILSFSPPARISQSDLPFSFTPLTHRKSEDDSIAKLEAAASLYLNQEEQYHDAEENLPPVTTNADEPVDRRSAASPLSSRPWNLETSYPWNNQVPELEVTMPDETQDPVPKLPKFKLRIHRASSSTGKLTKMCQSSEAAWSPFASSNDVLQGPAFRRKRDPNLTVFPGQINSSHAMMQTSPQQTRFVDSFEQRSPVITLLPPSPGHEVRSFFSDDSSQVRPRGSLRKRFSDFKARIPRAASSDEKRSYDRGLLTSALGRSRTSGRNSRQSEHTVGGSSRASRVRRARWTMFEKLRIWWHHGQDKVQDWGWKMRYRRGRYRATSTPLYAGV